MSTLPLPQFFSASSPAGDMVFCREMPDFRMPENDSHHLNVLMPPLRTDNHQPCVSQHISFSDTKHPWHTNQVYSGPGVPASTQVTFIRTPHNVISWGSPGVQSVVEVSSSPSSPTAVNERHDNRIVSASYSGYDPGQNATHWDSHAGLHPPSTFQPASDGGPLTPLVHQETSTFWHRSLDRWNAYPSLARSSYVAHSHYSGLSDAKNATEPFIPYHSPPYQLSTPASPHCSRYPMSARFPDTDSCSHLAFYCVPHSDSTGSSHHRRAVRAIEYGGLWIDEEDLLKGLLAPDGKFNVHQCRWEEDHSPCHLWIKGDKSSIKAHIQKWHGGKPGGDKHEVDCCWSACGKTMLKESIVRHIVSIHLGEMWKCQGCGKDIARNDAYGRHAVRSDLRGVEMQVH